MESVPTESLTLSSRRKFAWVDGLKVVGLAWIVPNRTDEPIAGFLRLASPGESWAPVGEGIAQLAPIVGRRGRADRCWTLRIYPLEWVDDIVFLAGFVATAMVVGRDRVPMPPTDAEFYLSFVGIRFPLSMGTSGFSGV